MNDRTSADAGTSEARAAGDAVTAAITQATTDAAEARDLAQQALEAGNGDATISERLDDLEAGVAEWHDRADDLENEIQALETVVRQQSETISRQGEMLTRLEAELSRDQNSNSSDNQNSNQDHNPDNQNSNQDHNPDQNSSHGNTPPADTQNPSDQHPQNPSPASSTPQPGSGADDRPGAATKRHRLI